jgi:RraA family protein
MPEAIDPSPMALDSLLLVQNGQGDAMAAGLKILKRMRAAGPDMTAAFRALPVANVSDSMQRLTAAGPRLRPMHAGGGMTGPALTVKAPPGDNLMLHKAIGLAQPGDVIVVDAGGDLTNALLGEMMLMQAEKRGVAGIVINGAIRDAATLRGQGLPVFAAGVTHRGPYKNGPGEINTPIAIDGMVIEPGDLMLGDDDGVLCVPFADLAAVLKGAQAKFDAEQVQMANIASGAYDAGWVDALLRKLGCEGLD